MVSFVVLNEYMNMDTDVTMCMWHITFVARSVHLSHKEICSNWVPAETQLVISLTDLNSYEPFSINLNYILK